MLTISNLFLDVANSDGCTVKIGSYNLPYFYKDFFTLSYVSHDVCYDCVCVSLLSCPRNFCINFPKVFMNKGLSVTTPASSRIRMIVVDAIDHWLRRS